MKTFSSCFWMKENEITPKKKNKFLFFPKKNSNKLPSNSNKSVQWWSFLLCVHVCIDRIDQSSIVSIIFILDVVVWYANVNYIHTQWLLIRVSGLFFFKVFFSKLITTTNRKQKTKSNILSIYRYKNGEKKNYQTNRPHTNKQTNNWIMNDQ